MICTVLACSWTSTKHAVHPVETPEVSIENPWFLPGVVRSNPLGPINVIDVDHMQWFRSDSSPLGWTCFGETQGQQ